jgi:tetratricopeptide (TPR) repeat protein
MMRSMCLGMIADFEERSGDFVAAIASLDAAIELNDALGLRGFNGVLLARLGWTLLHVGELERAERVSTRALDLGRRLNHTSAIFTALSVLAVLHGLQGRNDEAVVAATEALELHRAGSPRRLSNRIDPRADVATAAAACNVVLAGCAADAGHGEDAARLLGLAEALRAEADRPVPDFQAGHVADVQRAASSLVGSDTFRVAFGAGRADPTTHHEVAFQR